MTPEEILLEHRVYFNDEKSRRCLSAMIEFGKQCFEAGRTNMKTCKGDKMLTMLQIVPEFDTYEDYLKSLEDE